MNRNKAIAELCIEQIKTLTSKDRYEILLSWWGIDEEDSIFHDLSTELQNEIVCTEEPPENVMDKRYDQLIMEALKGRYIGVRNEYISEQLSALLGNNTTVEGETENLYACPCCTYKTLSMRGHYFICPVCHWEDGGSDENSLDRYSGPNHMTLAEAKNRFFAIDIQEVSSGDSLYESNSSNIQPTIRRESTIVADILNRYHK